MSDKDSGVFYFSGAQLRTRYGVSNSTIWRWVQVGRLPPPVRLSPRTTRWRKDEIEAWEAKRKGG